MGAKQLEEKKYDNDWLQLGVNNSVHEIKRQNKSSNNFIF